MTELAFSDRVRFIGGARYEHDELRVDAVSTLGSPVVTEKNWPDVLPSAALNLKLTETQSLRASFSRTLARPEYRELSPITSRDVIGGDNLQGDPNLERTRIWNGDLRWEWYPAAGEVVSVALFGKQFEVGLDLVGQGDVTPAACEHGKGARQQNACACQHGAGATLPPATD